MPRKPKEKRLTNAQRKEANRLAKLEAKSAKGKKKPKPDRDDAVADVVQDLGSVAI